ncbi:MAG: pyridoxal phosphate-dependent aminotransferase [Rubripirellula sp.]|nr:pyridoxal phosphate-dependent aminotransferase [Rubripirellula sp.]
MQIKPFLTEQFFALYEFTAPHVLASSDCETTSIAELLELSGGSLKEFGELKLGYTESQGNPEYRRLVAEMYGNVEADDVVILTSPVEGIYLAMQTLLDASDEVIALSPAYDALHHVADHLCGKMQSWELVPTETGWEMDLERLESLVNSKTQLIIVNFPHNPCGYQPTPDEFEQLVEIARRNDCWLFCDEIYRGLETEWQLKPTLPSAADVYEKAIVLHGLSKTYGLPGLRAGWLIVRDKMVREQLIGWKHYTTICPAAPTEYLSIQALSVRDQLADRNREIVRANLLICTEFMKRHSALFRWRPPTAGSTGLVEIDFVRLNAGKTKVFANATDYCHDLAQKHGVLLLPGACLGCDDRFVRIGLGRSGFPIALAAWEATLLPSGDVS